MSQLDTIVNTINGLVDDEGSQVYVDRSGRPVLLVAFMCKNSGMSVIGMVPRELKGDIMSALEKKMKNDLIMRIREEYGISEDEDDEE